MSMPSGNVGVMLPRDLPAGQFVAFARKAEELGFAELWVVEDLGYRGGVAQAATALAATSKIIVGIGILPAAARNVAFAAMEMSTLAQLHPGRLRVGVGHGMPRWMSEVDAWPAKPLSFLREYVLALCTLMNGQRTAPGRHVRTATGPFVETAAQAPPVLLGVRGPKSLAAAGEIADGIVLAEPASPEYIAASLDLVRGNGGVVTQPIVVTYDLAAVDNDPEAAQEAVRPALGVVGEPYWRPHVEPLAFADELGALRAESDDASEFASRMPPEWIPSLALAGTPDQVRAAIATRHASGATTVVLTPVGSDALQSLDSLARVL